MVLSAGSRGHVFVLIVELVVAGLGASDELRKRVVLEDRKQNDVSVVDYWRFMKLIVLAH